MADIVGGKAISLVHRGGIREVDHSRVFHAEGSQGDTYTVVFVNGGATCSCEAGFRGNRCYHVVAARLVMNRERDAVRG